MAGKRNRKHKKHSGPLPLDSGAPPRPRAENGQPGATNGRRRERSGTGPGGVGLAIPLDAPETGERIPDPPTRVVHVNVRFIVIMAAVVLVLAMGVHFLHAYQMDRHADLLLARAETASADGETKDALALTARYLEFRPHDAEALSRYGTLLEQSGDSPEILRRAFFTFQNALNRNPEREDADDLRGRLVDLAVKLRRHSNAIDYIDQILGLTDDTRAELLAKPPRDPAMAAKKARSLALLGKYLSAVNWYLYVIEHNPETVDPYAELAGLIAARPESLPRQTDFASWNLEKDRNFQPIPFNMTVLDELKPHFPAEVKRTETGDLEGEVVTAEQTARAILQRMVEKGRPSHKAHLARATFRQSRGELELAAEDIERALAEVPQDAEVLLSAARLAVVWAETLRAGGGRPAGGRQAPGGEEAGARPDGDPVGSEPGAGKVGGRDEVDDDGGPEEPVLDAAAVRALIAEHIEAANRHVETGLALENPDVRFYLVRNRIARFHADQATTFDERKTHLEEAEEHLEDGIKALPDSRNADGADADLLSNVELELLWSLAEVRTLMSGTVTGEVDEEVLAAAQQSLAAAQQSADELREKGIDPPLADFLDAGILVARQEWSAAVVKLEAARQRLSRRPDLVRRADLMLGVCYKRLANPDARREVFRRALRDDPNWVQARQNLADALVDQNRIDEALREYDRIADVPGVAITAARLAILKELSRPAPLRQWDVARRALHSARGTTPGSLVVPVLAAEIDALEAAAADQRFRDTGDEKDRSARDESYKRASDVLTRTLGALASAREEAVAAGELDAETVRAQFDAAEAVVRSAVVRFELRRLDVEENERRLAAADRLNEARTSVGDHVELRLAAISLALTLPDAEARESLNQLAEGAERFPSADRSRLLETLARAWAQLGDRVRTRELWTRLAQTEPGELSHRLVLAQLALDDRDIGEEERGKLFTKALREVRKLEEPDFEDNPTSQIGPNGNLLEGLYLLDLAGQAGRSRLAEARKLRDLDARIKAAEQARKSLVSSLERPRVLLTSAARQRPGWVAAVRALGDLEALAGNTDGAVEHYRRSISLGDRSKAAVTQVVAHLSRSRKYDEADQLIEQVSRDNPQLLSDDLGRLASQIAFNQGLFDEALPLATGLSRDSTNFRDKIWEAQVRFARGEQGNQITALLEDAIRLALEREPDKSPQAFLALVVYHLRTNDKEAAEQAIASAREKLPADPPYLAPFTLARLYELVERPDDAGQNYEALLALDPSNVEYRIAIADFYARNKRPDEADGQLDYLLDAGNSVPAFAREWARRSKALVLADGGTYEDTVRGLDYLERATRRGDQQATLADLRVQASLVARLTTRRDRKRLIGILEQIDSRNALTAVERFQLARLYEAVGNWAESRKLLEAMLAAQPTDALLTAQLAQGLVKHGQLEQARPLIERLGRLMPDSLVLVLLRARLLAAEDRSSEAVPLVLAFLEQRQQFASPGDSLRDLVSQNNAEEAFALLENHLQREKDAAAAQALEQGRKLLSEGQIEGAANVLNRYLQRQDLRRLIDAFYEQQSARLLADLKQYAAAEQVYRGYLESSTTPEDVLVLVAYVTRQGRIDEALDLCEQAWQTCRPGPVANASVAVLRESEATPEQVARVEGWLTAAIEKTPDDVRSLVHLADLRDYQKRYDDAEALYRQILQRSAKNVVALNNLAWLKAVRDPRGAPEALLRINRAIEIAGPAAELLDTRAVVYLSAGDAAKAVQDMTQALEESATDRFHLHLAQAQAAAGNREAARQAFEQAQVSGFEDTSLHPLERPAYDRLLEQLGVRPTALR
ncbi:MAG TPA: tetratricopeptide repeat protein [Planctomycetaceae bacterium]|nr:tetratricopeptide repeat protein [Planctomycetaceae bacterium]